MQEKDLESVFGLENLQRFNDNNELLAKCSSVEKELDELSLEMKRAFRVELSWTDVLVASVSGIVSGALSGSFKSYVPKHGKFKHKHSTTRTAVDYQVPKPKGTKGDVQGLHRQIGPGHDLARFKEALDLMSGETNDFPLWGSSLSKQTGGVMHPGNMPIKEFLEQGGYRIPDDPKKELINHLVIDFFTKTSLPIPGTSYLADKSEDMAKIMLLLYEKGLNLKNAVGNTGSAFLLHLLVNSYVFLLKSVPQTALVKRIGQRDFSCVKDCYRYQKNYEKSSEYHVLGMIAFGSSFMTDTIISTASKNYVGLLELNYLSLLVFTKHLVQYLLVAKKKRSSLKETRRALFDSKKDLQQRFYQTIQNELSDVKATDGLLLSMDPATLLAEQEAVSNRLSSINELMQKRKEFSDAETEG